MMKEFYKLLRICMLLIAFMGVLEVHAQQITVTGKITDTENPGGLPGVNVVIKGMSQGTVTNIDGQYSLEVPNRETILVFSSVGFLTEEVIVGNRSVIDMSLTADITSLEEVVVIGYSSISRDKILGSTTGAKADQIQQATPTSALEGVQGRLAGVQIVSNNGPGQGFDIKVRGVSTFGSGTQPLFVVDGQQLEDIDNLDPADIETLEVLKDGATAAIYGSRAANGVVIITTKGGKAGDFKVDVSSIVGINTLVGDLRLANSRQRTLMERAWQTNPNALTGNERDSLSTLNRNSHDLQDLMTQTAIRSQTNIAVSGGNNKSSFYWNTGILEESGIIRSSGFRRYNTMLKVDADPTKGLKIGTKLNLTDEKGYGQNGGPAFTQMVERIPNYPIFEPNGDFTRIIAGRQNPLAIADLRVADNFNYRAQSFSYAQVQLHPNLTIKSTLGLNYRFNQINDFNPIVLVNVGNPATGRERRVLSYDIQQENFLNFTKNWGKHFLSSFAGMQTQKWFSDYSDFRSNIFVNDRIPTFNNTAPGSITSTNNNARNNLVSLFAGFNYDFDDKYLIGATIRRDGSSRFGDNNKYGLFPSVTVGWRVSNESFMNTSSVFDNLLLRASFGVVGNERIGDYEFTQTYRPGYVYDGISGIAPTGLGNPELGWESTSSINLGFDLSILKNRMDLSVDVWEKTTTGLLANTPLPEESGFSSIRRNIGAVNNRGIDINLNGDILKRKDFTWTSNFNIGLLENRVTRLAGGTPFQSGAYLIEEGQPIGNVFGFNNLGVFQYNESNAFTPDGIMLTPNFDPEGNFINYTLNGSEYTDEVNQLRAAGQVLVGGDVIWEDLDGNGIIDADDRKIIGNGLPNVFGGFSNDFKYKNLRISLLFDFTLGHDIYRRWDEFRNDNAATGRTPGPDRILGAWQNPGDQTDFPRLSRVPQNRLFPNSFFVTDGSFVKWRYIRFNYDLPSMRLSKVKPVKKVSVNFAINNVLTWTNYIGYNPELGSRGNALEPNLDNLRYPNDREFILGLKVQF